MSPAVEEPSAMRRYKTGRFHQEVEAAKIRILREWLRRHHGNRTHTALALGVQRTYLLRLIRKLRLEAAR